MKRVLLLIVMVALGVCSVMCEAADLRVYRCPKVCAPPVIDGRLDDAAWKLAPTIELVLSETGKPVTKKTIARMCWDDTNLYVGFEGEDEDVYGTYLKRDDPIYNEEVYEVFIAPDGDITRYYEFNVSPRNVVFDAMQFYVTRAFDTGSTAKWNCKGLRTGVFVDGTVDCRTDKDKGWSAEFAIPFASLGTSTPKPGARWRGNLYRIDLSPPPAEFQAWSPTFVVPAAFHVPKRFGTIFFEVGP